MKKMNLTCPVCSGAFEDLVKEEIILECPHCGNSLYVSQITEKTAKLMGFNLALEEEEDDLEEFDEFDDEED